MANQSTLAPHQRLPLSALAMAWTALASFFVTSGHAWPVLVFALAIGSARLVPWRFPRDSFAPWILRLVIFAAIGLTGGVRPALASDWLMDARTVNILGLIAAAELTLQFWRDVRTTSFQPPIVLLAALVFLIASNTFEAGYIRLFTPPFMLFTIFALRDLQPRAAAVPTSLKSRPLRGLVLRWVALAVVLGSGFAMHSTIEIYRGELMSLGMQLLNERRIQHRVGVSMRPRLSSRFNARESPQRVLRIVGDLHDIHLRAGAFDFYANGFWNPPLNQRQPQSLPTAAPDSATKTLPPARITRLIDIEGGLLFAPLNVASVAPGEGSELEYDFRNGGPLRSEDASPYEYHIWESARRVEGVSVFQGVLCAPLQTAERGRYLQLPLNSNPRVRELAQRITKDAWHPAERAQAIAQYLMANHKYSREARRGIGDPVANFLLERRDAHCEYFASATVILLRNVGVPARYVVGYLAHESDGPDSTIVRQRDAHAWAEAWIDGVGWVSVDATPGDGRPDSLAPIPAWRKAWEKAQDQLALFREKMTQLSRAQWAGILLVVVGGWAVTRLRLIRRKVLIAAMDNDYASPDERLREVAARFESWMARHHHAPPSVVSWRQWLEQPQEEETELPIVDRTTALEFTRQYERVRWGRVQDDHALQNILELMNELEKLKSLPTTPKTKARLSR